MDLLQTGTHVRIEHHFEIFEGVVVGHGFVHRADLKWSVNNLVYPVLLIEVRIGGDTTPGSIRVIAPDSVEITVLPNPNP